MSQTVAFVTGATGHQGGATARELVNAGVKVHALVRDPSSKSAVELQRLGVQLFPGDFDNLSSLKNAVEGTTAIFLNVTHAKNIIDTAIASGTVTSIVYSSVTMAGNHEGFPNWGPDYPLGWYWQNKAQIESMVRASGVKYWTPTASWMFPELIQRRVFLTAYKPGTAMTVVDSDDVGKFAAAAITEPLAFNTHEIDFGVESLTPAEIVQELGRVAGEDIGLQFYSEESAKNLAEKDPRLYSQLWANEKYPIRLTKFADYLENHRDQVLQTFK
ncbi:hypothetical protein BDV06DRAFT_217277 [Aspergillus oleicola]